MKEEDRKQKEGMVGLKFNNGFERKRQYVFDHEQTAIIVSALQNDEDYVLWQKVARGQVIREILGYVDQVSKDEAPIQHPDITEVANPHRHPDFEKYQEKLEEQKSNEEEVQTESINDQGDWIKHQEANDDLTADLEEDEQKVENEEN